MTVEIAYSQLSSDDEELGRQKRVKGSAQVEKTMRTEAGNYASKGRGRGRERHGRRHRLGADGSCHALTIANPFDAGDCQFDICCQEL